MLSSVAAKVAGVGAMMAAVVNASVIPVRVTRTGTVGSSAATGKIIGSNSNSRLTAAVIVRVTQTNRNHSHNGAKITARNVVINNAAMAAGAGTISTTTP